jgi:magnesium and cobalt transporter
VIEQIVGDIEDEYDFDETEDNILLDRSGRYRVKAVTEIGDFNNYFNVAFPDEDYDTVGGLVVGRFGRLPKRGESIVIDGYSFQVLRADSRKVHSLLVEKPKPQEPG